jgi:hypothetical protein
MTPRGAYMGLNVYENGSMNQNGSRKAKKSNFLESDETSAIASISSR